MRAVIRTTHGKSFRRLGFVFERQERTFEVRKKSDPASGVLSAENLRELQRIVKEQSAPLSIVEVPTAAPKAEAEAKKANAALAKERQARASAEARVAELEAQLAALLQEDAASDSE